MKTFEGKLIIDRTPDDEWGKLVVDDAIRQKCFDPLGLGMIGFSLPDYEFHITIGVREEDIDGCVDNVVRLFNDYLKDDFDVVLDNL